MSREIRLSQRFVEKLREQEDSIHDKIYYLIKRLENKEPVESKIFLTKSDRKLYRFRLGDDLFVIYSSELRGSVETILMLDLARYTETYGLMRSSE